MPNGTKVQLRKSASEFAVVLREGADVQACTRRLASEGCGILEDVPEIEDRYIKLMRVADTAVVRRRHALRDEDIQEVHPVYRFPESELPVMATGEIVVKVRPHMTAAELDQLWSDHDILVIHDVEGLHDVYLVRPVSAGDDEVLRAEVLATDRRVRWAQPNFRRPHKARQIAPADPLFPLQWHLENTGQTGGTPDADIDAPEAWLIAEGQDVLIGAFDDGFDVEHEDLRANYSGRGHDPSLEMGNEGFNDPRPKQLNDRHGTSVIGLAAAGGNAVGGRGVAYLSTFAVSRGVTSFISDAVRASAFSFARQEEVDVHLNSWGSPIRNSAVVEEAIRVAQEEAREIEVVGENGEPEMRPLGMVVIWASGNEGQENFVGFDYSTVPQAIGVGASTHNDEQAFYSNYGINIDMLAPAGDSSRDTLVTTDNTDRVGAIDNGYNVSGSEFDIDGKYTNSFSGTSAACPIVAGVAALILSVNPMLTANDVRLVLEHTCDRVNPDLADYHEITSRSVRYGYGRVNAHQAVIRARESLNNGGVTWPGRAFNVRVADNRLRWQASVGTIGFLVVQSDSPFSFIPQDGVCYDNRLVGCRGVEDPVDPPSGVSIVLQDDGSAIVCDPQQRNDCELGDDQSIALNPSAGTKYFGIYARNRIGRYSWGVAADSLGSVTDAGPILKDLTDDGSTGGGSDATEKPIVTISVTPLEGTSPLTVRFMGNAVSSVPIDESQTQWDFDVSSLQDTPSEQRNTSHEYIVEPRESRTFTARLVMVDTLGRSGSASVMIRVHGPQTSESGNAGTDASLRILVGTPGNPTADTDTGPSPFSVELSIDVTSLDGTLQSILWDLGDGSPLQRSLVVPHTYINETDSPLVIPISATVTTQTSPTVTQRMTATRIITVQPGRSSTGGGPPRPDPFPETSGPTSSPCGAIGLLPLFGCFLTLRAFRGRN